MKLYSVSLKFTILFLFFTFSVFAKEGNHKMFIKIQKDNFEFGDSVPCEIIFVNTSDEPLCLPEDPSKSVDLFMHAVNKKNGEDLNYTIGKINVCNFDKGQFALSVPVKEPFEIAPRSMYFFKTDLNSGLYLSPGTYDCFLVNYMVEKSNILRISLTFTTASVKNLVKTAADERMTYARREWACDWLKKINPEFTMRLSSGSDSEQQKKENAEFNQKAFNQFVKWWDENCKNDKYLEIIKNMNM